ncbi:MAG: hypothetical protein H0X25_03590, partial [Acidobacteriales bacterium]|nr:hypothetical protein [Terriglobales bacterium]
AYTVFSGTKPDAPSQSPGQGLKAGKESARFELDTTPPQFQKLTVIAEGQTLRIAFEAADRFSNIQRAEFSVDGSDWQFVAPVGEISDSPVEKYELRMDMPLGSRGQTLHTVLVRVYDDYDNVTSGQAAVSMSAGAPIGKR